MFRGRHIIKMEERGRIFIPSRIREVMNVLYEGKLILTCGFFENLPHILMVPLKEWERFESEYPVNSVLDRDEETFLMKIRTIGSCEEVRIDDHGRIILPEFMRQYAKLGKEIIIVGLGKYMAIFSPAILDRAGNNAEKKLSRIRESLTSKIKIQGDNTSTNR